MQSLLGSGATTGIAVVGNEGLLGTNLLMGAETTPVRVLVQSAGHAYRLPRSRVQNEFSRHGEFMSLVLRYTQALLSQTAQTVVCNWNHLILQQLCRWLLLFIDRIPDIRVSTTQEFIADMLGVRRESVTDAASKLKHLGLISCPRGVITVLDCAELESVCYECCHVVRQESDGLLDYVPRLQIENAM